MKFFSSCFLRRKHLEQSRPLLVVFLPDWSKGNPYQNTLLNAIEQNGCKGKFLQFSGGLFSLNRVLANYPDIDIIHIHWINDLIEHLFWSKSLLKKNVKLLFLGFDIILTRLRGVKVVWTVHNLVSHESPDISLEIRARRVLSYTCSKFILHSHGALVRVKELYLKASEKKIAIIPHGNYLHCYPHNEKRTNQLKDKFGISDKNLVILFFGAIRRYKGISNFLRAFSTVSNPLLRFIIAGRSNDTSLTKEIINAAEHDSRIVPSLDFISDEDVASFFSLSDIVVMPFERTLTSGSVILAMSMGKALLLPNEARVFDIVDESGAIFYDSQDSLARCVMDLDKKRLIQLGAWNSSIAESLDWNKIGQMTVLFYKSV